MLFIIYICNINTNSFVKYECINENKYEYISKVVNKLKLANFAFSGEIWTLENCQYKSSVNSIKCRYTVI